jgi:hypothetical protein
MWMANVRSTYVLRAALKVTGLFVLGSLVAVCAKNPASPGATAKAAPAPNAGDLASQVQDETQEQQARAMEKRPRFGEAAVYVDGRSVGVLRALELPPKLAPHLVPIAGGEHAPRYAVTDYVRALGIDLAHVKGVHFYGGTRVVPMDGDELRRLGDRLMFSFAQGDRGKPRMHWPSEPIAVPTTIDIISALTVYVEKTPPAFDRKCHCLVDGAGVAIEGVPYAPVEQGKGTRVYVDGALVATVKRKTLTNDVLVSDEAHPRFSLARYLAKAGVDVTRAREIDFVSGDDLFSRMSPKEWLLEKESLTFSVPARNQGQAVLEYSSHETHATHETRVSAIELFVTKAPPSRAVTEVEAFVASADDVQRGGGDSQDVDP